MSTSEMIRKLCEKEHISIAELARRIGQSAQNLHKKLKRNTVTLEEMIAIAKAVGAEYLQKFSLGDGTTISAGSDK